MKLLLAIILTVFIYIPAFAQTGEIVVVIRQIKMESATGLFTPSVEAQRAERWEVVKKDKRKVELTFGPNDERRKIGQQEGKVLKFIVAKADFNAHFVSEAEWATMRLRIALDLQVRFPELTIEQAVKFVECEYWIGMQQEIAAWIVGNRLIVRELIETENGTDEVWKVAAFSVAKAPFAGSKDIIITGPLAFLSRPRKSGEVKLSRKKEQAIRTVLTFRDGVLTAIARR